MVYKNNEMDEQILKEDKKYLEFLHLNSNDIVLDAGAHIGGFSLNIFDKVKTVISVEADKTNFKLLNKNLKSNKIKNVIPLHRAIVHTLEKETDFFLNPGKNSGAHSLIVKRGRQSYRVKCVNINDLIEKYKINKIKMDIEGSEFEILRKISHENYLKINEMIFEFHFKNLADKEMSKYYQIIGILERYFKEVNYPKTIAWTKLVYCKK